MSTLADLRPGDAMFTTIEGIGGKAIAVAEKINDADVTWHDALAVQHVAMVTLAQRLGSLPSIVQAMPNGAEEIQISQEHWTSKHIYVRPDYARMLAPESLLNLPYKQAEYGFEVAEKARRYIGTPYSFLDYVAIAGLHLGISNGPIRRYVTTSKHMICSQLVDQAMCDAGFHVFDDGRLPQDVTPAALFVQLLALPGTKVLLPTVGWVPAR